MEELVLALQALPQEAIACADDTDMEHGYGVYELRAGGVEVEEGYDDWSDRGTPRCFRAEPLHPEDWLDRRPIRIVVIR